MEVKHKIDCDGLNCIISKEIYDFEVSIHHVLEDDLLTDSWIFTISVPGYFGRSKISMSTVIEMKCMKKKISIADNYFIGDFRVISLCDQTVEIHLAHADCGIICPEGVIQQLNFFFADALPIMRKYTRGE